MRQIFPPENAASKNSLADPVQIYELGEFERAVSHHEKTGQAWVVLNMISSLDGSAVAEGPAGALSGGLGSGGDKEIFRALRGACDFVLVASHTLIQEKYGVPKIEPAAQKRRRARGQSALPRLVAVSTSLSFNPEMDFLNAENPPVIYATESSPAEKISQLQDKAEIRFGGRTSVDLKQVIDELSQEARLILVEGGPSLNGALFELDLIDKLCLTVSPQIVGGDGPRIVRSKGQEKGAEEEKRAERKKRAGGSVGLDFLKEMKMTRVLTDEENFIYLQLERM